METPSSSNQPEQVSPPSIPLEVVANAPANEDEVIAIDDGTDDAPQDGTPATSRSRGSQRKLTSAVWNEFTRVCVMMMEFGRQGANIVTRSFRLQQEMVQTICVLI